MELPCDLAQMNADQLRDLTAERQVTEAEL